MGTPMHKLVSAYGMKNVLQYMQEHIPDGSNFFVYNKKAFSSMAGARYIMTEADFQALEERYNRILPSVGESVNSERQFALRDQTETEAFKRWFAGSQVVNEDGSPKTVYHQTAADFTVFNTDHPVAGENDSETPNGIFFKTNDHDIGLGGNKQMAVYLKAEHLLHFANRKEANAWYCKNVEGYAELQKEYDEKLAEFDAKMAELNEAVFDAYAQGDYDKKAELEEIEDRTLAAFEPVETRICANQRKLLDNFFLSGESGYDGIELDYDGHRYVNGVRENVHTYIVFSPEQIKSATDNVGTFDPQNPDIRYARRDDMTMLDVRQIMGGMRITDKMNDTEKDMLTRYQSHLTEMQKLEQQIAEQKAIIDSDEASDDEKTAAKARMTILSVISKRIRGHTLFARLVSNTLADCVPNGTG